MGHQQGDMAPGFCRHHLGHGADGGQGGEIAGHVVVIGQLQHGVRAARTRDGEPVPRLGVEGEAAGGANITVQGEVDVDLQGLAAEGADGEGADDGLLARILPAGTLGGRGWQHNLALARPGQHDLDMGTATAEGVIRQFRAGQADSAQMRTHIVDMLDGEQARAIDRGGL
ncbi:hypothetical protein D3C72_1033860 [compost metagenome]